jgi:6-phosphogluconate dehydrogenase
MKFGVIGLGRMGNAIAARAAAGGHTVFGFDLSEQAREQVKKEGVTPIATLAQLAESADIIWIMVPAGEIVDRTIESLKPHLTKKHLLIDGGNSKFTDSQRRARELEQDGIAFLDCGTSGGVHGREHGFCLMVGGTKDAYDRVAQLFDAIAAPGGHALVGPSGAGHYVKMVHNGIEYGLLQAYAEGFALIKSGTFKKDDLDLAQISELWNHGSVIRSFILELAHNIFAHDQQFDSVSGEIAESGMGLWTVEDADRNQIAVPVIKRALDVRAWSRTTGGDDATKIVALLRQQFGGHAIKTLKD